MRRLHEWLAIRDPLPAEPCDAVIGFGHFDLEIPRHCAALVRAARARYLIFTGGIGAGTADLGMPEADAFVAELARRDPELAAHAIAENCSTNTAENIRFTQELLLEKHPQLAFGRGIRSVLLVATPCRQRRVFQTWRKLQPNIPAVNAPASHKLETLAALYDRKREDILEQMLGEYRRLRDYPPRGWIAEEPIPEAIHEAAKVLSTV
jgi:uncharacterized SAM-binding protein YcdF (DUF218 family)